MNSERDPMKEQDAPPWWRTRHGLVFLGFLVVGAFFLITEHRAHLVLAVPYFPWILLLVCVLMVLVMLVGHVGPSSGDSGTGPRRTDPIEGENRP